MHPDWHDVKHLYEGQKIGYVPHEGKPSPVKLKIGKEIIATIRKCDMCEISDWSNTQIGELCTDCLSWQSRMKKKCVHCDVDIPQTYEQRKLYGNYCEKCLSRTSE